MTARWRFRKVAIFQIFRFIFDIFITTNFIFTKILTKFSNQYSNLTFVNDFCLKANRQKEEIYKMIKEEEYVFESIQEEKRVMKLLF